MHPGLSDPPRLQGRFRIDTEIARGGMGTVYAAVDDSTGQRVALKRLTPGSPPRIAALFEREFYVLSSLEHPCIIQVHDYGIDADGPFYTMELLEGSDLRELSPLPARQACRYLCDVASSLALLHARRLLHRDVSPRNVRALADGRCKLLDFGALTSFGTSEELVGTPPAIPPEALSGQALDRRADLYSLGALAYFMLTGRQAYPARSVSALPETWLSPPAPPSRYAADVPPELDRLVLSLLSLDVLARPSSASEVIEQLRVLAGLPPDHDDRAARSYFVAPTLVERERELDRVRRRLQRASEGQGGAVFVSAEPGMGKTRFLTEVAVIAQLAGVTALRVDAAARSAPLSAARSLVQQLFRVLPKTSVKIFRPHGEALRSLWPDLNDAGESQPIAPPNAGPEAPALPAFLEDCVCGMARKHPLLIAVDNAEHVDAQSAALLLTLARAARTERLLIVSAATVQSGTQFTSAAQALRDAGSGMQLRPLTEDGVTALVRTAFGDVPHVRRTATRLFAATRGNLEHCMRVLQHWVDSHVIEYAGGAWNLPLDLSTDVLSHAEHFLQDRLRQCSERAQQIAGSLAVLERPATLDFCMTLDAAGQSRREIMAALDELVQAEILSLTSVGYRFLHEPLRHSIVARMDAAQRSALSLRVAEALLVVAELTVDMQFHVGLLLIRGGEPTRGLEVIRKLARSALAEPVDQAPLFARCVHALEAALEVCQSAGHSRLSLLDMQVPLALAGFHISPAFSQRYVFDTVASLERVLGVAGESDELGAAALRAKLMASPVLEPGETATATTPDVVTLVSWLIRCVMSGVGTATAAIDHEAQERAARALRRFRVFGREHPAAVAHEYCRLVISMTEGHPAASHAGWLDMLARLPNLALASNVKTRLRLGALYSLGVLECQRDDDVALSRMRDIDEEPSVLSAAYADQLRFLYYSFRGNLELAQRYRDRVEAHAVQYGSAWQIEMWSTCTLSSVYSNTRDVAGNKQATDQLERLKQVAPSLEQYWERAAATKLTFTGEPERAIELYHRTLARSKPNERVAWSSVRGSMARAYNILGRYEDAKHVCEETIALCEADMDFVAQALMVRIELCRALAGLGEFDAARERLDALLALYAPNQNPVTLGALHRTGAEIARLEGDAAMFDRHLNKMRAWHQPTKNPALIAQCDQLKAAAYEDFRSVPSMATALSTLVLGSQAPLSSGENTQARRSRALEVVAEYHELSRAWLYTRGMGEAPHLVAVFGIGSATDELVPLVRALFEAGEAESDETAYMKRDVSIDPTSIQTVRAPAYRLLPLTVDRGTERWLVGVIAFPADGGHRSANHELLREVATQLFEAGDLVTVRSVL